MNEPVFARSEYENRLSSVRATMNRRGVDALLVLDPRNVNYLAGVDSQGISHLQCLVVTDEEPTLVTWDLEAPGVELTSWLSRIVTYSWLEDPAERVADAIAGLGLDSKRLAIELRARELSAATFAAIRERLPEASFLDAFGIVESARLRKSRRRSPT